jgi:RNA recognition motif-containing protein
MKDLFREAGSIIRADVAMFPDGRPKGTGIVVFESHEDAKNAVGRSYRLVRYAQQTDPPLMSC